MSFKICGKCQSHNRELQKYYQSFNNLCKRVKTLKTLNDWIVQELEDRLVLKKKSSQVMLPEIQIMIDDSLGFTIYVYGWLLPEDHELYTTNLRSVTNITVSDLVKSISTLSICPGVKQAVSSPIVKQYPASCNSKVC